MGAPEIGRDADHKPMFGFRRFAAISASGDSAKGACFAWRERRPHGFLTRRATDLSLQNKTATEENSVAAARVARRWLSNRLRLLGRGQVSAAELHCIRRNNGAVLAHGAGVDRAGAFLAVRANGVAADNRRNVDGAEALSAGRNRSRCRVIAVDEPLSRR